jgi:hypothetical protein
MLACPSMAKPPNPADEAQDDPWALSEGRIGDSPAIVRAREFLPHADPSTHAVLFIADWDFEDSAVEGMPQEDESLRMEAFEDALVSAFERENDSICVLFAVITCDGHREWRFYCREISEAQDALNEALSVFEEALPIDLRVEDDPEWKEYTELMRDIEAPS